mgnify:CR=1 FL=1
MHIISRKIIKEFCQQLPEAEKAIDQWYRIVKRNNFRNFSEVKSLFPSADQVGKFVVFDIGGNKYRLVASIIYKIKRLYIRHVLTHSEYDRQKWKEDPWFKNMKK